MTPVRRYRRKLHWLEYAFPAVLLLCIAVLIHTCAPDTANAEWVTIRNFGGIRYDVADRRLAWGGDKTWAAVCTDWLPTNGELERPSWGEKDSRPVVSGSPINFILPTHNSGEIIYRTLYGYNVLVDSSFALESDTINTVSLTSGDSVVLRTDPPSASEAAWERLTLTDIRSVVIDRSTYSIWGFYDNDTLILKGAAGGTTTDTLYGSIISLGSSVTPPDAFVANDTTWIVDGTRLSYYTNDSAFSFSYPTYNATGAVTRMERSNDTLYAIGAFSNAYGSSKYVFHVAGLENQRGIPFEIMRFADNGSADTLFLRGDSSRYAAITERTAHSSDGRYVITRPDSTMPLTFLRYLRGTITSKGVYGGVRHWVLDPEDTTWIGSVRDWDCKIVRWKGLGLRSQTGYAKIIKNGTGWNIHLWAVGASAYSTDQSVYIAFYQHKPLPMANVGKANEYTIAEWHRGRAWYAGSTSDDRKLTYSYDFDYDSLYSAGIIVNARDPITGLSSMGDLMVAYLRHGIVTVTGVSPSEFYFSPVTSQIGASSNHVIARNPYDNSDYFVNEDGLWKFDGGSVSKVETGCDQLFRDSIYWPNEKFFSAAVWDGKYWFSCMFGVSTGQTVILRPRLLCFDLQGKDVSFVTGVRPGFVYRWTEPQLEDRLFVGDRDSTVLWEMNASPVYSTAGEIIENDDVRRSSVWQSGHDAFGDSKQLKRINSYRIDYQVDEDALFARDTEAEADTVIVQFLGTSDNLSVGIQDVNTAVLWADTTVRTFSGGLSTGVRGTHYASVGRAVIGYALAVKIISSDYHMRITEFAADVVPVGDIRKR